MGALWQLNVYFQKLIECEFTHQSRKISGNSSRLLKVQALVGYVQLFPGLYSMGEKRPEILKILVMEKLLRMAVLSGQSTQRTAKSPRHQSVDTGGR